jgi:hypothetical protein
MNEPSKLVSTFLKPFYQLLLIGGMTIVFTLIDFVLPHNNDFFAVNAGPWIVATAMILCFVILNCIVALKIEPIVAYWSKSVVFYFILLAFCYLWCFLLSGKQIDDVGSFRWLWFVLTLVYMVFFVIARSMKRIVDLAISQDEKLKSEE